MRTILNKTISEMLTNPLYNEYLFYCSVLSKTEFEFLESEYVAYVYFCSEKLNYVINIDLLKFSEYSLQNRMAILKHEVLHIIWGHLKFRGNIKKWQLATDCAINQFINSEHLPLGAILPETLGVPERLSSQEYYELIDIDDDEDNSHFKWDSNNYNIQTEVVSEIIESSTEFTLKHSGVIPQNISEMISLNKPQNNLEQKLRRFMIKDHRYSIKKSSRRFPDNLEIKGKIKTRKLELSIILDVSGSIRDSDIKKAISEILRTTKLQKEIDLIQVDSEPRSPEKLTKHTKFIERTGRGGTYLSSALEYIKTKDLIIITDGRLFDEDIKLLNSSGKNILWILTTKFVNPGINSEFVIL